MGTLYDQFGREIQVTKRPEMREIAVAAIRDRWSNYPSGGLTPQTLATIFKEADMGDIARQAELFEEMEEKDAHLYSELQTRKNAVHGLDYDILPWSESAEDKNIRDFVADCLFNLNDFEDALLDLLDAIGKGYSLCEIMWGFDAGKAVISRLDWIHAKKAVFYERGAANMWAKSFEVPRILTEAQPIEGEQMPPFKLVYHRYKARAGYDTRAGILRVCAWMYLFKNYALKDWVAFAEIFGMPLRLGKYDTGASKEDKDALVAAIQSLGSDAAGIISKNTEIEFVEAVKNAGTDNIYETLANFCDKQMSKAILGQTATTEGTPGKLGNEDAQDRVRHDLIKSDSEGLAKTIRYQIVRPMVGYNFGWDKPLPWFKFQYERGEDLGLLSTVYKNLREMGQPMSAEHVSDRFKIPLPAKGETPLRDGFGKAVLRASKAPDPTDGYLTPRLRLDTVYDYVKGAKKGTSEEGLYPGSGGHPEKRVVIADIRGAFTPDQQAIEGLADGVIPPAAGSLITNEQDLLDALQTAGSYEEAMQNVLALYPALNMDDLARLLENAALNADLFGRYAVSNTPLLTGGAGGG